MLIERFKIHWKKIGVRKRKGVIIENKYSTTIYDRVKSKDIVEINTENHDVNEKIAIGILKMFNQEWYKLL